MTDDDQELLAELAALNTKTAAFGTDLFSGELDREAGIGMALLLLDVADRVLKRVFDKPETGEGDDT